MAPGATLVADFTDFVEAAESRIRLALGAAFGFDVAEDATAEAFAFAWEHWDQVSGKSNPIGFVFGVGRNKLRQRRRRPLPALPAVQAAELPWVEPGLPKALERLSERQRQVVMLLHCFQWTLAEVAETLDMAKGTVQVHERRGLDRLRRELGVQ